MFSTVKHSSGDITVKRNGVAVFDIVFSFATTQAQKQQQEAALLLLLAEANSAPAQPRRTLEIKR